MSSAQIIVPDLDGQAFQKGSYQAVRVCLGRRGHPVIKFRMSMQSRLAALSQLFCNTVAVSHEGSSLLCREGNSVVDSRLAIHALVAVGKFHSFHSPKSFHEVKLPGRCVLRVLVTEVAPFSHLVMIKFFNNLQMGYSLSFLGFVVRSVLVQVCKYRKRPAVG